MNIITLVFATVCITYFCQANIDTIDYFGQTPPKDIPLVFARGIISSDNQEHGAPAFTPDGREVFWQTNQRPETEGESWLLLSMTSRCAGGQWSKPVQSVFGETPIVSPDGKRLYFGSSKPGADLWYLEKQETGWSEQKNIDLISRFTELRHAYFPSIAANGTLYFMGYAEGQWINLGIYRAEILNGIYAKPELLPESINSRDGSRNWTPYVAPDESYLIFCSTRGLSEYDQGDLFISFRQSDGNWTEPVNMGTTINTHELERFPSVSPDGKYLFFTRDTVDHDEDVFWVSAGIIEELKSKALKE